MFLRCNISDFKQKYVRPFGILRESPSFHFYVFQFITFLYALYRFSSRDYSSYGLIPEEFFNYARGTMMEIWPIPILHFTSFQFIYEWLPRPNQEVIQILQYTLLGFSGFGLLGILPRIASGICFLIATHLTGFMQMTNGETDGGELLLCAFLILSLTPQSSFYKVWKKIPPSERKSQWHWPVFLFMLVAGAYYTMSGLNKVFDIGPHWPFVLRLDLLSQQCIETSLFVSNRYVQPAWCVPMASQTLSILSGWITLIGEIGFISILFIPRTRAFFIITMIALHFLVFVSAGINFTGSSALLLVCFDWNRLVRKLKITQLPTDSDILEVQDETGEVFRGASALREIFYRKPKFLVLAWIMSLPPMNNLWIYKKLLPLVQRSSAN